MSKCVSDGGECGLGGYCAECPNVLTTSQRLEAAGVRTVGVDVLACYG